MRILLTNDDGILAPGLGAVRRAIDDMGEIQIVAPESAQSGAAHSITITEPLICQHVELPQGYTGYSVSGRPADCVKLAMAELLDEPPDLVISGINAGANVGVNVLYSGTVAAAVEATFFDVPAIAISLAIRDKVDFDWAATAARDVIDVLLKHDLLCHPRVLNVNLPPCEVGKPKGMKVLPQSTRGWNDRFERKGDTHQRVYFLPAMEIVDNSQFHKQTDEEAIDKGYVSITPLKTNLTDDEYLETLRSALPN